MAQRIGGRRGGRWRWRGRGRWRGGRRWRRW